MFVYVRVYTCVYMNALSVMAYVAWVRVLNVAVLALRCPPFVF